MSERTVILNARLPLRPGRYQIVIEAGNVLSIIPAERWGELPEAQKLEAQRLEAQILDVSGDWISPGAIDLQINGGLGLAFPDLRLDSLEKLQAVCELLWEQGVNEFCPTLVTTSLENFHGALAAIAAFLQQPTKPNSARVIGAHLEGPFLNPAKRGAHPKEFLQPLTLARVKQVIGPFAEAVSIVTLAPETADEEGVLEWLVQQGIAVSLGHSLATEQQARAAFGQGATMVTHAFNAMPGLHHRQPGLLGAALTDERVFSGFIADGEHINTTMLDLLLRCGRGDRSDNPSVASSNPSDNRTTSMGGLFLVSDALSPLGLPDGTYPWDSRQIEVKNGTARLPDGTLSGTTLPLIAGAQNLVKWGLASAEEAIALVTSEPRLAMKLPDLEEGSAAHLLRWHQDIKAGELTWQRI